MHPSRSSCSRFFHWFVADIWVASCFLDGRQCKRTHILHQRFDQFPRRPRYEVLNDKHEQNGQFSRRLYRLFLAQDMDFCEVRTRHICHIFWENCLACFQNDDCVIVCHAGIVGGFADSLLFVWFCWRLGIRLRYLLRLSLVFHWVLMLFLDSINLLTLGFHVALGV